MKVVLVGLILNLQFCRRFLSATLNAIRIPSYQVYLAGALLSPASQPYDLWPLVRVVLDRLPPSAFKPSVVVLEPFTGYTCQCENPSAPTLSYRSPSRANICAVVALQGYLSLEEHFDVFTIFDSCEEKLSRARKRPCVVKYASASAHKR